MQTALHIRALVGELKREVAGGEIVSTEFYKKERAAYLFIKHQKTKSALGFVYHPAGSGIFLVPASKVRLDTREKPWPVFGLEGAVVESVEQVDLDRLIELHVTHRAHHLILMIEAIGPNGNLWLLDEEHRIKATLRKKSYTEGKTYEPTPLPPGRFAPFEMTDALVEMWLTERQNQSLPVMLEKRVLGFNRTMVREAIRRAGMTMGSEEIGVNEITALVRAIRQMAERFDSPDNGYLYETGGRLEVYPFKLTAFEAQPEKYRSLSLAVLEMTTRRQARVEQADEEKMVLSAVSRTVKRLERRLSNIESDVEKAADYERYRRLGELLQIHLPELKKGMDSITLPDAYSESGEKVKIGLDPALTPSENVEAYFRKHRKGREGLALLRRRKEITFDELAQARRMQQELEIDFEPARQKYRTEIESLLPGATDKKHAAPRLPYKEYTLSSGVTIFVGREGADNDRTTFEFARPYELWFHAQQCPGSHVVMKFPNKSFKPSKSEIEETAACAAWHSKARNDSLVPVIYAERRYVRKPRRARPGLVTVQREKSVMVEPKAPG